MIHSITFSNISSFFDEAKLDLTWDKKDSIDDTSYEMPLSGVRVSKVMAILGPNASGKSNMIRVLDFVRYWIVDAWERPLENRISRGIIPFMLCKEKQEDLFIDCIFETEKGQYRIELTLREGFAVSEKISTRTASGKRTTWKTLFNRNTISDADEEYIRKNASILFTMDRANHPIAKDIVTYWNNVKTNITRIGEINSENIRLSRPTSIISYHNDPKSLTFLNELLQKFDTGFSGISIMEKATKKSDGTTEIEAKGIVKTKDGDLEMPYLSDGTIKIVDYAYPLYHVLHHGGILVFDELDSSFHPEVVDAIIDLFLSDRTNPKHAQIIFTTHNPRILRKLHRYQIQLVEKDADGISHTYRLDEVEGVRVDDNYYAKYMAGAYGALPHIDL